MRFWLTSLFAIIYFLSGPFTHAAETDPVDTGEVLAQMVSDHNAVTPGQTFNLALYTILNEGWHTYWRNPGDSGEPVELHFKTLSGATLGEIIWPLPQAVPTGPIINYGFEGAPLFPIPLTVDSTLSVGGSVNIEGMVTYLVCKDICIPEYFDFEMSIPVKGTAVIDARWSSNIKRAIKSAPIASNIKASSRIDNGRLIIDALLTGDIRNPYIYPVDPGTTLHSEAQNNAVGSSGIRANLALGYGIDDGLTKPLELLLGYDRRTDSGDWRAEGIYVTAAPGAALDVGVATAKPNVPVKNMSVVSALIAAFIGGLILNLMPCVFPVISLKALSFARHAHEDRAIIRRQGWFYTVGVLATFLLLTIVLLAFKAAGAQIGWGFQLQNPAIVGGLALLLFAIALNLIGAFEVGGRFAGIGQEVAASDGAKGAFFTGALAVIVATPCTAPFMAGAIAYALGQSTLVTLLIFSGLAVGFAAPFLLLAYMPGLLARLPKPGPWMVTFKEVLAFPMFAAAIWLVWVLSLQTSGTGLLTILAAMLGMAFVIWIWRRQTVFAKIIAVIVALCVIAAPFTLKPQASHAALSADNAYETSAWSPQVVLDYQAENRAVFVDFTAAWCVTCKVNELGALSSKAVSAAMAETNTVKLIADWTNKNDVIAAELEKYGRAGIPLYLYYGPDNNGVNPEILPQILTENMLVSVLTGER